ncbi:PAS domain-containing sensor histidine kinase [Spirochaeta isovalerica]|uniref:histidine kinase n=1 Tax=Spirochaeta isovalerica TaxID=150 RepID=A0A841RCD3_9SPIO|nr:PAS domain-containing sensor histidine kinase [Spirochaeta isovalerica]MBB6480328.1 hypothetical protein [Spirochaeta isovalerica]
MQDYDRLRRKAEEILQKKKHTAPELYTDNLENLVEELQIYQIELEHQNEELIRITREKELSAKKAQALYDQSPAGYITLNDDQTILEANATFLNFLNAARYDVLGKKMTAFIAPQSQDAFYFHFQDLQKAPETDLMIFLFFDVSDTKEKTELRECRVESRRFHLSESNEWRINITVIDVTQEKELERLIDFEKEIWKQSFASVNDAIFLVDKDYIIRDVNASAEKLTGRSAGELIGTYYYLAIHGHKRFDDCPGCRAISNREACQQERYEEFLNKYLDIAVSPVIVRDEYQFSTIVIRDISDKKEQEKHLKESEKRFRTIFDQNVAAMCLTNESGFFEMVNEAYVKLYKYTREELIGNHFTMIVPEENREYLSRAHDDFIREGKEIRGEWQVLDKEGKKHTILADAAYIEGTDGSPKKVTFVVDITALKQALEDLIESKKQLTDLNATKDKFFSIVAHDLKNPLSTILNFSQMLQSDRFGLSEKEKSDFLVYISEGAGNINRLLDNLLTWSRAQRGLISFTPVKYPLKEIVENNIQLFEHNAGEKGITIVPEIIDEISPLIDGNMIDTVVRNLISNAIKFTGEKGRISVRVEKGNPQARVSIIDNGVGMSQEKIDSLFNIATNMSTKGTNHERGSGLGLLICKEFIEKHKGQIRVESKLDEGSSFIFEI